MVAVAGSRLTADMFLQMTATLAHISHMENVTSPMVQHGDTMTFVQRDRGAKPLELYVALLKTCIMGISDNCSLLTQTVKIIPAAPYF